MSQNHSSSRSLKKYWVICWLWFCITTHVIIGLIALGFIFPLADQKSKANLIQKWSKKLLIIFGIELKLKSAEILPEQPFLLAANHISWMDIHAINAFRPIRFVAKSDVQEWPIFGWMAKQLGTIFIKRNNARHGKHVASELGVILARDSICIFPEGTSTVGESVLPFKPNLFESAVIAQVPVYSLAISYKAAQSGDRSEAPAFVGDMGLFESMSKILHDRKIIVELAFLAPSWASPKASQDRKWLALHSQEAVSSYLKGNQRLM